MLTYPITFCGSGVASQGTQSKWEVTSSGLSAECSVPKEFEGCGGAFSPEDFFLLAVQNCFIATFKVYAQYSNLKFDSLRVEAELIVDKNDELKPVMKSMQLKIEITNSSNEKKSDLLIKKTLENGFILQSVKTEISVNVEYKNV